MSWSDSRLRVKPFCAGKLAFEVQLVALVFELYGIFYRHFCNCLSTFQ